MRRYARVRMVDRKSMLEFGRTKQLIMTSNANTTEWWWQEWLESTKSADDVMSGDRISFDLALVTVNSTDKPELFYKAFV